jgi:eukaryotic-like serine/threonine-protein kinase
VTVPDLPTLLAEALKDRYAIQRELGRGGMATVYLAEDLKHRRPVAVKVLQPELAAALGPDRFLREIELLARLSHPHILPLHDSGNADGFLYYVMPYVTGETLRARLAREKQLPVDEALQISREVADALSYAHAHGVIHRDIKPENILLESGHAVVADFGIARAVDQAGGAHLTETGMTLGTPAYMSPEQAGGGGELDGRSDLYSLGCVLYEMLAGQPPFTGPTVEAMVRQHITADPPCITAIRPAVPAHVVAAIERALAKTPADRFNPVALFAEALGDGPRTPEIARARRRPVPWLPLAGVAALLVAAVLAWRATRAPAPAPSLGRTEQLTADDGLEIQPALSPDGRLVAYSAGNSARMRIFLRPVGGGRTIPLSDDSAAVETGARWSPDGTQLLFLTRGGVSVAPALGGTSRPVVAGTPAAVVRSAAWSPDGTAIAVARGDSLLVLPLAGGEARALGTAEDLHSCAWNPNGRWIACVSHNAVSLQPGRNFGNIAPSAILLFPTSGGVPLRLLEPDAVNESPTWSPDGRRLFFISSRDGPRDVYAVTVTSSGRARGAPRRITAGVGALTLSLSADGTRLAYEAYSARANIWSLPVPGPGQPPVTDAGAVEVTTGSQVIEAMRISRDGRWLLYDSNLRGNADIYRIPIDGGPPEQLTAAPADEFAPDLSPDGRAVAYHSWRTGTRDIEVKPLDGGPIEYVTATPAQESYPLWSPDGTAILFFDQSPAFTLLVVRRTPTGAWDAPVVLLRPMASADWSPDGRMIAYVEGTAPHFDGPVMVMPADGGSPRQLFVPSDATPPAGHVVWGPDGATLYYKAHDDLGRASFWSVRLEGGPPRLLVRFPDLDRQSNRKDFATDGRRFFFAREERQSDVFVADLLSR